MPDLPTDIAARTTHTCIIYGASDDLVEVEGPCIDSGQTTVGDRAEYGAWCNSGGPVTVNKTLAVHAPASGPYARVYCLYDGTWSFALAGFMDPLDDQSFDHSLPSAHLEPAGPDRCPYSMMLVLDLPNGHYVTEEE